MKKEIKNLKALNEIKFDFTFSQMNGNGINVNLDKNVDYAKYLNDLQF